MANLASTYRNQDRLKNTEALGVEVIEMDQVNDDDHPHTLRTMENLADTYRELGCLDETEALEAVVEEKRKLDDGS